MKTGRRTTWAVDLKRAIPFIATVDPARSVERKGVITVARRVEAEVIVTERATSPPARSVTRLEAVPPGEQPTRERPRKRLGGREKSLAAQYAERGMRVNWQSAPVATTRGLLRMLRKSSAVRVVPMPTMIAARATVIVVSERANQPRVVGEVREMREDRRTQRGNKEVKVER
jgi:hypothetical protein